MKIIGKAGEEFLVQMTKDELAKLVGCSSTYSSEFEKVRCGVGDELKISEVWHQIHDVQEIYEKRDDLVKELEESIRKVKNIKIPKYTKEKKK